MPQKKNATLAAVKPHLKDKKFAVLHSVESFKDPPAPVSKNGCKMVGHCAK
ncbi:hypothetical protein M2131_000436 [Polynucleobacter sphagniphilus]|nr:hypothetical protein [Polynucleobacter sphagniphilus]